VRRPAEKEKAMHHDPPRRTCGAAKGSNEQTYTFHLGTNDGAGG